MGRYPYLDAFTCHNILVLSLLISLVVERVCEEMWMRVLRECGCWYGRGCWFKGCCYIGVSSNADEKSNRIVSDILCLMALRCITDTPHW